MWHEVRSRWSSADRVKHKTSKSAFFGSASTLLTKLIIAAVLLGGRPVSAAAIEDLQAIGLPPLYEALFAVANCANVDLDRSAFVRAAALYHLSTDDLTSSGPFAPNIAVLDARYRARLDDDRAAFCSVNRLGFSIPFGILVDRGPVLPHPLPFASTPAN